MESPLFVAMTRPPSLAGVDMEYCLMTIMATLLLATLSNNGFFMLVGLPLYVIGYIEGRKDKHFFKVMLKRVLECRFTQNNKLWGCEVYEPF